jgi:hypothetical protein
MVSLVAFAGVARLRGPGQTLSMRGDSGSQLARSPRSRSVICRMRRRGRQMSWVSMASWSRAHHLSGRPRADAKKHLQPRKPRKPRQGVRAGVRWVGLSFPDNLKTNELSISALDEGLFLHGRHLVHKSVLKAKVVPGIGEIFSEERSSERLVRGSISCFQSRRRVKPSIDRV